VKQQLSVLLGSDNCPCEEIAVLPG